MIGFKNQLFSLILPFIISSQFAHIATIKDTFTTQLELNSKNYPVPVVVRIPRESIQPRHKTKTQTPVGGLEKIVRRVRDSKYFTDRYESDPKNLDKSLKPEDNPENSRIVQSGAALGKRCSTCDGGYLGSTYSSGRDGYDRYYDRDPYSSGRDRYDRYDRYDRDRYIDKYDDYDRDTTRGRSRYSTYDRYEPRDRYYDRGIGYDNRGYDPFEDYYSQGSGYDSISRGGGRYASGRPETYGGFGDYAKGYIYGERDRYGGYRGGYSGGVYAGRGYGGGSYGRGGYRGGSYGGGVYGGGGYGAGFGDQGYGSYSLGGYGGYGATSGYDSRSYGGSRPRYPYSEDTPYRPTSYLHGRPSATTTDIPKSSDEEINTQSPSQSSSGRS